jgi:hypothetical protein
MGLVAFTESDLAALKEAYASGTLKVRFSDGREVAYPSGDDLLKRIRIVEIEIAAASTGRITHINPVLDRGLN